MDFWEVEGGTGRWWVVVVEWQNVDREEENCLSRTTRITRGFWFSNSEIMRLHGIVT